MNTKLEHRPATALFPDVGIAPPPCLAAPEFEALLNSRIPGEDATEEWLAGALCVLATGLGPSFRLLMPDGKAYCPNFSAVIRIRDDSDPSWYERLVFPLYQIHSKVIDRHVAERAEGWPPAIFIDYFKSAAFSQSLQHAVHDSLLVGTYAPRLEYASPLEDYRLLPEQMKKTIAEIFVEAWEPLPAEDFEKGHRSTVAGVFLPMNGSQYSSFLISPFFTSDRPPPVLLLSERIGREPLPRSECFTDTTWVELVYELLDFPQLSYRRMALEPSADAVEIYEAFKQDFEREIADLPTNMRHHLRWLPDLALKTAIVIHALRWEPCSVSGDTMENAVKIVKWLGNAHYAELQGIPFTLLIPDASDNACLTDTDLAVLRKIRQKYPVTPRDLLRSCHNLRAAERDEAIERLVEAGKVRWRADGKLEPCLPGS